MKPPDTFRLTPGKRILFLTKDAERIRRQLSGELDLVLDGPGADDPTTDELLDDINTDMMAPGWVCFEHRPAELARDAYAGLVVGGERVLPRDALRDGGFEVIVSGYRKGVGSSRETATQAEKWCGIRLAVAASFAPIHARNNVNQGVLMAGYDVLRRLQAGEGIPLDELVGDLDPIARAVVRQGGLFPFARALAAGEIEVPGQPRSATAPGPKTMTDRKSVV